MQDHGVTVQKFQVADNAADAERLARELSVSEIVLKAQVGEATLALLCTAPLLNPRALHAIATPSPPSSSN